MADRSGIMLCYPFEEKRLSRWDPPYIVQPKLDGERCRGLRTDFSVEEDWILLSSSEEIIVSVPHITKELTRLNIPISIMESDGELYKHGWTWEEIHSVVSRTVNIHPDHEQMEYHIFDLIVDIDTQMERLKLLNDFNFNSDIIKRVPHVLCWSLDDVLKAYDALLEQGYEGMIVRHLFAPYIRRRSIHMMKFKPKKQDYYMIVGYKEEIDIYNVPKGRLGALVCESDGQTFAVGSGLNDEQRASLWKDPEQLIGKICVVDYQHITPGRNVPRFPVFNRIQDTFMGDDK